MRMYSIEEFSKLTGLSISTLRNYDELLKPLRTPGGQRRYTDEHLKKLYDLGKIKKEIEQYDTVIYCRVSTPKQKESLERQVEYCEQYCVANGWKISKVIRDIGSSINFNRSGINELLSIIKYNKPKRIVVADKDRLARIGFDLIKNMLDTFSVELIIINEDKQSDKVKDIVEELVHIVHLYAMRIYGARSYKRIKKLKDNVLDSVGVKQDEEEGS